MDKNGLSAEDVGQLYERHGPALLAYACGFGLDRAQAEDAVHAVFHRLLRNQSAMPRTPVGYLYRAVRNVALNTRRDGARVAGIDEASFVHAGGDAAAVMALQRALDELPEEQREVVVMRIWSGMTLEEIATASDAPMNTIASRYRYALEKLREKLQPYHSE